MYKIRCILEPIKCKFIVVYLDDIRIHNCTLEEHNIHVQEVRTLLKTHDLNRNHAQCTRACNKLDVCGFDIDKNGIHSPEQKTCQVMDWPQPENSQEI